MIVITKNPIDIQQVIAPAESTEAGAVNVFIGTVRAKTAEKRVIQLEYEAYEAMAILEIKKIVELARKKWKLTGWSICHRIGTLSIGDVAVVVAVSTPHRKESFEACLFIIDTFKQTVPIWKKEVFEGGEEWVSAHP